jgi:hypothetical protein
MRVHPRIPSAHRSLRGVLVTLLAAGFFVVGPNVSSVEASQGAVVGPFPDFEQPFVDACTGELRTVVFTDNQIVVRQAQDAAGNFHEVLALSGNWSSGTYTGTFQNPRIVNDLNPSFFDDYSFTEVIVARGGDGSGTLVTLQATTHIRIRDGQVTASVERVDARCVAGR